MAKSRWPYLAIFALALLVRGLYLWELAGTPLTSALVGDGRQYYAWATEIAAGDWIGKEVFYQAPLYPYFMAVVLALGGPGVEVLRVIQILMGAASCVLVAMAGRRFFSPPAGLTAGALLAVYPPAVFFDGLIQKTALGLLLLSALLALAGELTQRVRWPWLLLSGVVLGCLALTRENALILVPVLALWIVLGLDDAPWPRRAARAALFVVGLAAVLVPVGLRNLAVGGRFLVTTAQLGPNFYIGNNPEANGRYRPLRTGREDARVERQDAVELAEAASGRSLGPGEVSRYWLTRSLAYVADRPGHWLGLLAKKAFLVANAREVIDTEAIEVYREHSRLLDAMARFLHFGVLGPLAVFGIWASRRRWRRLWVLYALVAAIAASLILFFVVARYRFSVVPVLVLFAAAGLVELVAIRQARSWAPLLPGAVLLVLTAVVQNWPAGDDVSPRATTYYNLGVNLFEEGRDAEAAVYLEKTLALAPDFAAGHHRLGKVLAARGDAAGAAGHYERALALAPDSTEVHFDLGFLLLSAGRLDEAAAHLRQAAGGEPGRAALAHNLLANVLAQQGKLAAAVEHYEEALRLDDGLADAHFKLGVILSEQGALDAARRHLEATVRLLPDFPEARRRLALVLEARSRVPP